MGLRFSCGRARLLALRSRVQAHSDLLAWVAYCGFAWWSRWSLGLFVATTACLGMVMLLYTVSELVGWDEFDRLSVRLPEGIRRVRRSRTFAPVWRALVHMAHGQHALARHVGEGFELPGVLGWLGACVGAAFCYGWSPYTCAALFFLAIDAVLALSAIREIALLLAEEDVGAPNP